VDRLDGNAADTDKQHSGICQGGENGAAAIALAALPAMTSRS
jgi:hypothetical protein